MSDQSGRGVSLNGHDFGPYHYAGMGNTERECSRCHFRQDEQLEDERVPPCTSGRSPSPPQPCPRCKGINSDRCEQGWQPCTECEGTGIAPARVQP